MQQAVTEQHAIRLQRGLGLTEDPDRPLVACITRLVPQKVCKTTRIFLKATQASGYRAPQMNIPQQPLYQSVAISGVLRCALMPRACTALAGTAEEALVQTDVHWLRASISFGTRCTGRSSRAASSCSWGRGTRTATSEPWRRCAGC